VKKSFFVALPLLLSFSSSAEPWVDTSNIFLRASIQQLADAGYIKTPTTTYPLMWINIANDLTDIPLNSLDEKTQDSYAYVMHQLKLAKRNEKTIEFNAALKDNRFTSFGDSFREKNNIGIRSSWISDSFAVKLSTTYSNSIDDKIRYDGSYLATFVGNWVISAGMQDKWWGNGWDSNLSLTNNARPIPALSFTRKAAEPFVIPFTEYGIPWTVTSFMGVMDDNRVIKDTLLWGFRLNFKPTQNLEIGITRLAQWGGEGRPQNGSTFWNVLIGKDNCGNSGRAGLDCGTNGELEPGNQQAGYDIRYTVNLYDTTFSLYGQYFAEDGSSKDNSSSILTEPQVEVGIDTHLSLFKKTTTLFLEYSDTFADCSDQDGIVNGNCFNEHHIYQTGMRYNQRTIGSLYDNDANNIVLGLISTIDPNTHITLKLRKLLLNKDNVDKAPDNPIIGNPLTKVSEEVLMISTKVQHSYKNWRFTLGGDYSRSTFIDNSKNKNRANLYLNIEHNL